MRLGALTLLHLDRAPRGESQSVTVRLDSDQRPVSHSAHLRPRNFGMSRSEFLVVVRDSCRGLSDRHQIQYHSLLRATVLQDGFSAHPSHGFTREARGLFDVI